MVDYTSSTVRERKKSRFIFGSQCTLISEHVPSSLKDDVKNSRLGICTRPPWVSATRENQGSNRREKHLSSQGEPGERVGQMYIPTTNTTGTCMSKAATPNRACVGGADWSILVAFWNAILGRGARRNKSLSAVRFRRWGQPRLVVHSGATVMTGFREAGVYLPARTTQR